MLFTLPLSRQPTEGFDELRCSMAPSDSSRRIPTAGGVPMWICTRSTQPTTLTSGQCTHAGLLGALPRFRTELSSLAACCVDVSGPRGARGLSMVLRDQTLRIPSGSVRAPAQASVEPESAITASVLRVPRMVGPHRVQALPFLLSLAELSHELDAHIARAMAALDMDRLPRAFELLEILCQQYVRDALKKIDDQDRVPVWHHKLLYNWCARQSAPATDVTPDDVIRAHPNLWAEVQLAERCGLQFAEALTSEVAYQELLFPGGSMDAVLPLYEQATVNAFYNGCVVAVVEAVLALLKKRQENREVQVGQDKLVVLEVGSWLGGTASSVLPVVDGSCERYIFTDVSEVFLRQVRVRFTDFDFVEYALLNIDADPRLQGFASRQCDLIISTNCLHATPFMRNTLYHCSQLLKPGGMLAVNEALCTIAFVQITFGMTDGWWLFSMFEDADRIGQDSPLLSWPQWQSLLAENGFRGSHCMRGDSFLRGQAVVVAQTPKSTGPKAPARRAPTSSRGGWAGLACSRRGSWSRQARRSWCCLRAATASWRAASSTGVGSQSAPPTSNASGATRQTKAAWRLPCAALWEAGCASRACSMRRTSSRMPCSATRRLPTSERPSGPRCTAPSRCTPSLLPRCSSTSTCTRLSRD